MKCLIVDTSIQPLTVLPCYSTKTVSICCTSLGKSSSHCIRGRFSCRRALWSVDGLGRSIRATQPAPREWPGKRLEFRIIGAAQVQTREFLPLLRNILPGGSRSWSQESHAGAHIGLLQCRQAGLSLSYRTNRFVENKTVSLDSSLRNSLGWGRWCK